MDDLRIGGQTYRGPDPVIGAIGPGPIAEAGGSDAHGAGNARPFYQPSRQADRQQVPAQGNTSPQQDQLELTGRQDTPSFKATYKRELQLARQQAQQQQQASTATAVCEPPCTESPVRMQVPAVSSDELALLNHEPVRLTGVLCGNLPGSATLWLSQYAHQLAVKHDRSMLVRLTGHSMELELYTRDSGPVDDELRRLVDQPMYIDQADDPQIVDSKVADLLQMLGSFVASWTVHVQQLDDARMAGLFEKLDRWTITTGADHASVIAAFQLIKQLTGLKGSEDRRYDLMFMGCDRDEAELAGRKVAAAARSSLQVPVRVVGAQQRMVPMRRHRLFLAQGQMSCVLAGFYGFIEQQLQHACVVEQMDDVDTLEPAIDREQLARWQQANPPQDRLEQDIMAAAGLPMSEQMPAAAAESAVGEPSLPEVSDTQTTPSSSAEPVGPSLPTDQQPADDPPSPTLPSAPDQPMTMAALPVTATERLVEFLPDSQALSIGIPHRPGMQLAVDGQGVLQIATYAPGDALTLNQAIRDLVDARQWASGHGELIARACPNAAALDRQVPGRINLFTDQPKAVTALMPILAGSGVDLKLHLLKQAGKDEQSPWVHAEIM